MSNKVTDKMIQNKTDLLSKQLGEKLVYDEYYLNVDLVKEDGTHDYRFAYGKTKAELMKVLEGICTTLFFMNGKKWK